MEEEKIDSKEQQVEYLRTNKDHLLESIALLSQLAEISKEGTQQDLFETWSERLEEIAKEYRHIVCVLESLHGESFKDERLKFETKYYALSALYKKRLKQQTSSSNTVQPQNRTSHIRFPEVNLPRFSGRLEDWCVFRDAFESAIGSRNEISGIDKFQYLKGLLGGEAARIVDSVPISGEGYRDAWRALKLRYENKRQLIRCHIKALFEIPSMKRETSDELLGLVDKFEQHISVLKRLGERADAWSSLLVHQLSIRLDSNTLREWENFCVRLDSENVASILGGTSREAETVDDSMPTYINMVNFLQNYARVLQSIGPSVGSSRHRDMKMKLPVKSANHFTSSTVSSSFTRKCERCSQDHFLYQCPEFQKFSEQQRLDFVKAKKLCLNCLRNVGHFAKNCPWKPCNRCPKKHHTLLHGARFNLQSTNDSQPTTATTLVAQSFSPAQRDPVTHTPLASHMETPIQHNWSQSAVNTINSSQSNQPQNRSGSMHYAMMAYEKEKEKSTVILPTALVDIEGSHGMKVNARCLLDSGSQSHFITSALCHKLQLIRNSVPSPVLICGIGQSRITATETVTTKVSSRVSPFCIAPQFLVIPSLAIKLPAQTLNIRTMQIPETVRLADPFFHLSQEIDIILGAEYFFDILRYGRIKLGEQFPILQNTTLGWIVSGACLLRDHDHVNPQHCFLSGTVRIEELLRKFWELETVHDDKGWSTTDRFCEKHFQQNVVRTTEGRYIVRLPKRDEIIHLLGDNKYQATRRFLSLERSLDANPQKKVLYKEFMEQYISMGHMQEVMHDELEIKPQFILPHHGVLKPESTTTKLRTVFDGSCKSRSGHSLNDMLLPGPTIQDTLVAIVLRFRTYRFVISADIEKMFRQILVHPSDQPLQRILWRNDPQQPLKIYQLQTVTYGLNNSPFLATRVINQLATDEESNFPLAATIAKRDFYVDNLLSGSDDLEKLKIIVKQMQNLLYAGGFPLRQWSSNSQEVLDMIPEHLRETRQLLELDHDSSISTLGLRWEPVNDKLSFKPPIWKKTQPITKRTVLSQLSSMFDPLGLLGPTIVSAKIIIQTLWKLSLDWDTLVPEGLQREWKDYQQEIEYLNQLKVPRAVLNYPFQRMELHGFSDASQQAYGACIYVRSIDRSQHCSVELITAKSRVAPVDNKSIPRLELSAALLLSHLLVQVKRNISHPMSIFLWTDSTIVLDWISAPPATWKTFVANRVAEIQEITTSATWNHVSSTDNPADLLSRGINLRKLLASSLWWHGPPWLNDSREDWPQKYVSRRNVSDTELRKVAAFSAVALPDDIIDRYSDLQHLLRICAWWHRFRDNTRRESRNRKIDTLSSVEIDRALIGLVRRVQEEYFDAEIQQLERNKPVNIKSKLRFLNPQLVDGIIRVGGRLHNSALTVDEKHPIVLPAKHRLTFLIAAMEHKKTLHGGPILLLASLRRRFWPLDGRNLTRSIVHRCIICSRARAATLNQMMGNLPPVRVNRAFPFENVGVDFAGPLFLRPASRKSSTIKVYVAVYVCLAVKAVHLDLVPDLSSQGFIASLRRFVGRRGKPTNIYCDNGRNFVGACRELAELHRLFRLQSHMDQVIREAATDGIQFHFIPPRSPSLGGIWEAAVKSMKLHLRRIMGNARLTETELRTVLIQVEATLNSRPISVLSEDPRDLQPLTPGHFLVGRPLTAIPEPNLCEIPENRQSRWQRVQCLSQHFWQRWHKEYLSTLQNRYRWSKSSANLVKNAVVLLRDENLPPQKWALGRVIDIHPGQDGLVRIVSVRTNTGVTKRAVNKLCLLPVEIDPGLYDENLQTAAVTSPSFKL